MLLRAAVLLHLQSAACAAAVSFAAGVPTLATKTQHAGEYVFFPQTLRRVDFVPKDTLLISYQRDADALHDDGWKGGLLGSSGGAPWQAIPQPHSPMLVKSCFEPSDGSLKCFEYPLRKLATNSSDDTHAQLGWQLFTHSATAPGGFVQSAAGQAAVTFPADKRLQSWGDNTFVMVTDGKITPFDLPNHQEGLLMLLYGKYANTSKYTLVATQSLDQGDTWTYISDVSFGAPSPCDNPSEHDCTYMADRTTLMCVWRSDGTAKTLCESRTADRGKTWTPARPLDGGRGKDEAASPIPSAPIGVEPKLERLNNGLLVVSAGRPGLYLWVAVDPTSSGSAGNASAALTWEGFNLAAHHNAAVTDPSLRYSSDTPSGAETTSYTGMEHVVSADYCAVVVSYDRLANGWSPAPYPPAPGGKGLSAIFTVQVNISKA